jgi:propionyl-CoA carboxylase alpha chain/3-methylcrotonyl-CoA carboxylase alpha subunit
MLAKLIVHGFSRAAALVKLQTGLRDTELLSLPIYLGFLERLLRDPRVQAGQLHTDLVDEPAATLEASRLTAAVACAAAIRLAQVCAEPASPLQGGVGAFDRVALDRDAPLGRLAYRDSNELFRVCLLDREDERTLVRVGGRRHAVSLAGVGEPWNGGWVALVRAAAWRRCRTYHRRSSRRRASGTGGIGRAEGCPQPADTNVDARHRGGPCR